MYCPVKSAVMTISHPFLFSHFSFSHTHRPSFFIPSTRIQDKLKQARNNLAHHSYFSSFMLSLSLFPSPLSFSPPNNVSHERIPRYPVLGHGSCIDPVKRRKENYIAVGENTDAVLVAAKKRVGGALCCWVIVRAGRVSWKSWARG